MIDFYSRLFGPPPEIEREPGGNQGSLKTKTTHRDYKRNHSLRPRFDRSSYPGGVPNDRP